MSSRLVLFDVDGTLVDSQAHILASMRAAFEAQALAPPPREAILSIVGLSLPVAIARLAPEARPHEVDTLVGAYRSAFVESREGAGSAACAPLYPGASEALARLAAQEDVVLGVATGKSRRGLAHVLAEHGLEETFVTVQTADDHPSKPNPAMILAAMAETGADAADTVMIGDTSFDVHMARAAETGAIGVAWGYHPEPDLVAAGAHVVIDEFAALDAALAQVWGRP